MRCVELPGIQNVEPFREIRPGPVGWGRGRGQSGHDDGSSGPGSGRHQQRKPATQVAQAASGQLPGRAEGRDPLGQPLVLSHRSQPPSVNAGISARKATRPTTSSRAPRRRQLRRPRHLAGGSSSRVPEQAPTTITRKSIADARAEWVSQQARAEAESARQGRAANGRGSPRTGRPE